MSVSQKKSFLKRVESVGMSELHTYSSIPTTANQSLADCGIVSVAGYENAAIDISKYTLKNIWAAAAELLQISVKTILPAPCMTEGVLKFCHQCFLKGLCVRKKIPK
jgi:hypothetical protein